MADANARYFYHCDGLGSVVALSDVNNVGESGSQEISLRLHPEKEAGDAVLRIGDDEWKQPFSAGQESILFQAVRLVKGNATLKATLAAGKTAKGPWQVDVTRKETQDRDR